MERDEDKRENWPHTALFPDLDNAAKDDIASYTKHDRQDMRRMGKKQELRRNFRTLSTIAFTTCVMGTWEILLAANTQGLTAGGLAGLFWSLVWCYTGQAFIVLSLAEMASIAPTAGGQYHWVSEFAPPSLQRFLSYFSGWLATISWQSIIATDCYLVGGVVQALIVLNDETYTPERWQSTLLIIAVAVGIALFNILLAKYLPAAEGVFAAFHVLAFIPVIACLWIYTPVKQSASAVFTEFTDNGAGWPSLGATVLVGQVSSMFTVIGSDSVAHMAEETTEAGLVVPRAMVWAFFLNVPFTFVLLVTYLFCIGDIAKALGSSTGFPFVYVSQNALGDDRRAFGLVSIVLLLLIMITTSSMASASRQAFAFARDEGLPFSGTLGKVDSKLQVPTNSIVMTAIYTSTLSLINIGSTVAFNAVLSLATTALMATYILSIGCLIWRRVRGQPLPHARWSLGKSGLLINAVALFYGCWAFVWSFFPNAYNITPTSFNWACVLFVGLLSIAACFYMSRARRSYEGPVVHVVKVDDQLTAYL